MVLQFLLLGLLVVRGGECECGCGFWRGKGVLGVRILDGRFTDGDSVVSIFWKGLVFVLCDFLESGDW